MQTLVEQWKDAGIRVNINAMPSAQFWDVWDKVPFGFTAWAHRPLGFMVLALGYRSGVPWNESHFNDEEFDTLLTKAEGTLDLEERQEILGQLQVIMQERGPMVQRCGARSSPPSTSAWWGSGFTLRLHLRRGDRYPGLTDRLSPQDPES